MSKDRNRFYYFVLFIIGVFSSTNVLYGFVVGSTPILIGQIAGVVCLIAILFVQKGKLYNVKPILRILPSIKLLFLCIVASFIPVIIFNPNNLYQWFVGIIALLLNLTIIISILEGMNNIDGLYMGIAVGIILNLILSMYALLQYKSGTIFTLNDYFPYANTAALFMSNAFSARGFFKEPGHLMRFLAIFAIPLITRLHQQHKIISKLLTFVIGVMLAFTGSATIAVFCIGFLAYYLYSRKKSPLKIVILIVGGGIFFGILLWIFRNQIVSSGMLKSFSSGFQSLFVTTGSNGSRIQGMKYALNIIAKYPIIGCGWNTLSKIFVSEGYYGVNSILGSYSGILTLFAEIGIGAFSFIYLIYKSFRYLLRMGDALSIGIAFSLAIYFVLFCLTDFTIDPGSAVFLAIALIHIKLKNDEFIRINSDMGE